MSTLQELSEVNSLVNETIFISQNDSLEYELNYVQKSYDFSNPNVQLNPASRSESNEIRK